jgi:hypothetical protein
MKTLSRILSVTVLLIEEGFTKFMDLTVLRTLAAAGNRLRPGKQDHPIRLSSMQINHLRRLPFALISLTIYTDILVQHFTIHPLSINLC